MCNRYSIDEKLTPYEMRERFRAVKIIYPEGADPANWDYTPGPLSNWNAAPTNTMPVVRLEDGDRVLEGMRWGLVPPWAHDIKEGTRALNARGETVAVLNTFRSPFRKRRCLVPATGYYEWQKLSAKDKHTYNMHLPGHALFAFAGLWEEWRQPDGTPLHSYTIITTEPNEQLTRIHNRMPVILRPVDEARWLDPELPLDQARALLRPYPVGELVADRVGGAVGKVGYRSPDCIEPLVEA